MRNTLAALLFIFIAGMLDVHAAGVPSDNELTRRVKTALNATIGSRARDIEIIVLGGVVSLHGRLATAAARDAAVSATERTPGVRGVADNLSVGAGG